VDKKAFLEELSRGLSGLSCEEQEKWLDFYAEMIDDRMEDGLSQEEAVGAVGPVETVVEQILSQSPPAEKPKKKRELKTWQTVLLIVGSPIWFSLLVAAASVVFSLLVTAWALVISFYAAAVAVAVSGLACVVALPLFLWKGNVLTAFASVGCGLFCIGLGIAWFIGTHYMTKGVVWSCKKLFAAILPGKEAVQ